MKKLALVFYSFLFLFTSYAFQASSQSQINFNVDGDDKVIFPVEISLCGVAVKCVGKNLEEIFYDISKLNNFIGKLAAELLSDEDSGWSEDKIDYQAKINEYIRLSNTTAWTPTEDDNVAGATLATQVFPFAGLTPKKIFNTYASRRFDRLQSDVFDRSVKKITPQSIKNEVEKLVTIDGMSKAKETTKSLIKPISFGNAWLKKPIEFKGYSQDIIIDKSTYDWVKLIDKLKDYFKSTIGANGSYRFIEKPETGSQEQIIRKIALIIESMKRDNLYPAPMDAFNTAWDALYIIDGSVYKYKNPKGDLRSLQDPEDVDIAKQALLDSFVAMPYVQDSKIEVGAASQAQASNATLSDDLAQKMSNYATQNKIKVNDTFLGKIIAGVQLPEGWTAGMSGLNTPSGFISNADIIKSVKSKSDDGDQAGVMSEHHYNILLKYNDELDPKDTSVVTVALRAGKTYKEYKDILAGGASQAMVMVSKDDYNNLLVKVQVEMHKKKIKPSLMSIKMTFTITQDYKNLKLPADYADVLFPALMKNLSYEDFMSSAEYKQYLEDNKVAPASTDKPVQKTLAPPVQQEPSTPPVVQKSSVPLVAEKKNSNGQVISDDKIFDDFKKSIKISNILSIEIAKNQLVSA